PLRFGTQPAVDGVFELYKPYAPLAANIDHDTHTVYGLLLGGLGLLWIALFRIVAGASRRLRRHADETRHQARHDATTGLPNRGALLERAGEAIARARSDGSGVALMLVDLDRFKEINDTLGHDNGDLLLHEVGARLQSTVGEDDMVARLGGDEFAVLLPGVAETDRARQVAVDIARALHEPIAVAGLSLPIDASIGIALFPEHGRDAGRLMQ